MVTNQILNAMLLFLIIVIFSAYLYDVNKLKIIQNNTNMAVLLLFTLFLTIQVVLAKSIVLSEVVRLYMLIIFSYLVYDFYKRINYNQSIRLLIFTLILPISIGILNVVTDNYSIIEGAPRLNGCYTHPNPYGIHLLLTVSYLIIAYKNFIFSRKIKFLIIFMIIVSLYLFSKISNFGGYLFMMTFIYFLVVLKYKSFLKKIIISVYILLVIFLLLAIVYSINDYFAYRINFMLKTNLLEMGEYPSNSLQWRIFNWLYYINYSRDFIFGNGIGSTLLVYTNNLENLTFSLGDTHNEYVRIYYEYGVIGLIFFFMYIKRILKNTTLHSKSIILSFLLVSFFDNTFKSTSLVMLLIIIVINFEFYLKRRIN
jgi:O-antigen ligase